MTETLSSRFWENRKTIIVLICVPILVIFSNEFIQLCQAEPSVIDSVHAIHASASIISASFLSAMFWLYLIHRNTEPRITYQLEKIQEFCNTLNLCVNTIKNDKAYVKMPCHPITSEHLIQYEAIKKKLSIIIQNRSTEMWYRVQSLEENSKIFHKLHQKDIKNKKAALEWILTTHMSVPEHGATLYSWLSELRAKINIILGSD